MMVRAGGMLFVCTTTERMCLFLRSPTAGHGMTWSLVGGKIHAQERILAGVRREVQEEMGVMPDIQRCMPMDVYENASGSFRYYSFMSAVDHEFTSKLCDEHVGYGWFDWQHAPRPLHPGAYIMIQRPEFRHHIENLLA